MYDNMIGKKVEKISGKPFKSGQKYATVTSVTIHPVMKNLAYTFKEDSSIVECHRCVSVTFE